MIPNMVARVCHFDPTLAPPGKTAVVVHVRTHDPTWWERLRAEDRPRYIAEKDRVARRVVDALDARFGAIRDNLEVVDVATPATFARYTNTWRGSYQGWAPVPALVGRSRPKRLPGLAGFYLAGQWVEAGGGLPRVALSARNTAQLVCHDERRPFHAPARRLAR
jgi:phytoene dehydrogenase-like protein